MNQAAVSLFFGSGSWVFWYGALFMVLVALMGTALYVWQDPAGPSAGPMIMLTVFFFAFVVLAVISTIDVAWWAKAAGCGLMTITLFVLLTWGALALLWTFLFWASDPNYPDRLLPGRLLFLVHSIGLYAGNLWLLRTLRRLSP